MFFAYTDKCEIILVQFSKGGIFGPTTITSLGPPLIYTHSLCHSIYCSISSPANIKVICLHHPQSQFDHCLLHLFTTLILFSLHATFLQTKKHLKVVFKDHYVKNFIHVPFYL